MHLFPICCILEMWEVTKYSRGEIMKEKCWSLRLSLIIMVAGMALSAIIKFVDLGICESVQDYLFTVLSGAGASALVTVIIYASEYKVAKVSTLEALWEEQLGINDQLLKMKYFKCEIPTEILQGYYYEKRHNDMVEKNRSKLPGSMTIPDMKEFSYQHNVLDKWCDLIAPKYRRLMDTMSEDEFREFLVREVEHGWDDCINEINSILDEYISLSQIRLKKTNNILGQIEFCTDIFRRSNKRKKAYIYKKLYIPMRENLRKIQEESVHFRLYRNNKDNFAVALNKLVELQKVFFTVKIRNTEEFEETMVYFDFQSKMDTELEDFRSKILYHSEPEYKENQLFAQHIKYKMIQDD